MRTKLFLVCFAVSLMMVGQILGQSIRVTGRVIDQDDRSSRQPRMLVATTGPLSVRP